MLKQKNGIKARRWITIAPWFILFLSAIFTFVGWRYALDITNAKDKEHFDSMVTQTVKMFERNILVAEDILAGAASFVRHSGHVDSKTWKNYVKSLDLSARHPGLLGIGYAEFIKAGEHSVIQPRPWPPGQRNDYIVTKFYEPIDPKLPMIGYDLGSDIIKRDAAEKSRDSGMTTLSRKNLLFGVKSSLAGAYLYIPIYKKGLPSKTHDNRRTAISGWVFMPLDVEIILAVTKSPEHSKQFYLEIFDGKEISETYAYSSSSKRAAGDSGHDRNARWTRTDQIFLYGTDFRFHAFSLSSFKSAKDSNDPTRLLWGSSLLSILLWALVFSLLYTRQRALKLAVNTSEDLSKAKNSAMAASQIKSEFLANMSHEIRTPIFAMSGMLDLLLDTKIDTEQRHYALTCRRSIETLTCLINDILDLSKVEAGKIDIETIPFDLHRLLIESSSGPKAAAIRKGLRYVLAIQPGLPANIEGDPTRFRQVLGNLLSNAIKFTQAGEITLRAGVVHENDKTVHVRVEVIDSGIGLSPMAQSELFKPFSQANSTVNREYGGAGLGLFISKGLVTLMQGTIGVESRPGMGSTFWFDLPLKRNLKSSSNATATTAGRPPVAQVSKRILVVEDNLINQEVTTKIIEKMGHVVECVEDGDQVLEKLDAKKFDLVIMDCQMHRMHGYEAARIIRTHSDARIQTIPIIAMTANVIAGERDRCFQAGMDDYISKPINRALFENMVSKRLEEYEKHLLRIESGATVMQHTSIDFTALGNLANLDRPGEEPVAVKCFGLFLKTTPDCLMEMQKAVAAGDSARLRHIAHSLKTSSATLGARMMAGICLKIEEIPDDTAAESRRILVDQLAIEYGHAVDALRTTLNVPKT